MGIDKNYNNFCEYIILEPG